MIPKLSDEIAFAARLKAEGITTAAFDGLTTVDQRRECFREAIWPIEGMEYTRINGRPITVAMEFARIYGCVP